ncbi:MAG: UDP-glucuronosyltransferase [Fibrobacteria bacterium]|nr:UDP-glucuronosyltransferase [Fibrobacteria bacterium]
MKILYGVPGEGMGHATRSKVVISHLLKTHDVRVVSSAHAFTFLKSAFPGRVIPIKGFHLAFKNAQVHRYKTAASILKNGPLNLIQNFEKYRALRKSFSPDLVISDFESFSFLFAHRHKIPLISIDNMQIINRCLLDIPIPKNEKVNFQIAKNIIKSKVPGCKRYFVSSFFNPVIKKDNTLLVPPILRDEIINAGIKHKNHILVYQTSQNQSNIVRILNKIPKETFLVYGFNKSASLKNVRLKPFSEDEFITDLASSKAIIANGGFSLISEAVFLHKPVCAVPLHNQFEQFLNAAYIEHAGYGRNFREFTTDGIRAFLYQLDDFTKSVKKYSQDGNKELFLHLDRFLQQ